MPFILEEKDIKSDYSKRQIVYAQESVKLILPLFCVICAVLLVLDITDAVYDYLPVYLAVVINLAGLIAVFVFGRSLVKGNIRQRELFEGLKKLYSEEGAKEYSAEYESNDAGVTVNAKKVAVFESEDKIVVLPKLPEYEHRFFTRYDFTGDFGKMVFPKPEFSLNSVDGVLNIKSKNERFGFVNASESQEINLSDNTEEEK